MIDAFFSADKYRVILSGEFPDYVHAVFANVSCVATSTCYPTTRTVYFRVTSTRRRTS